MLITLIHLQACGNILFESVMHGRIFLKCTSMMFLITQLQASISIMYIFVIAIVFEH